MARPRNDIVGSFIVELHDDKQLSFTDIASRIGRPRSTVSSAYYSYKKELSTKEEE